MEPHEPTRVSETTALPRRHPHFSSAAWGLTLIAAAIAGFAAYMVGETVYELYQPSEEAAAQAYAFQRLNAEMAVASGRNGALAFGALGALLGLAMGISGGYSHGSGRDALVGGLVGVILGGLLGALPAFVVMPWQWHNRGEDPAALNLAVPLMTHAALWCGLGLAAGIAFGIGHERRSKSVILQAALGGLIGAGIGTLLFEILGGFVMPLARTSDPFAVEPGARLLARLCVAGFTGLGILYALRPGRGSAQRAA